jgi:hypothetical protein
MSPTNWLGWEIGARNKVFGDKTFTAFGYDGIGLSIACGSVGVDKVRLKVVSMFPIVVTGGRLTTLSQVLDAAHESRCTIWDTTDDEDLIAERYLSGG